MWNRLSERRGGCVKGGCGVAAFLRFYLWVIAQSDAYCLHGEQIIFGGKSTSRLIIELTQNLLDNTYLMVRYEKLLLTILTGDSDANITFDELRNLLLRLGFTERIRGSHHVFRKNGVEEKINLQRDGTKAKVYQVRQIRNVILRYRMGGKNDL